jgi:hypothetical protein
VEEETGTGRLPFLLVIHLGRKKKLGRIPIPIPMLIISIINMKRRCGVVGCGA